MQFFYIIGGTVGGVYITDCDWATVKGRIPGEDINLIYDSDYFIIASRDAFEVIEQISSDIIYIIRDSECIPDEIAEFTANVIEEFEEHSGFTEDFYIDNLHKWKELLSSILFFGLEVDGCYLEGYLDQDSLVQYVSEILRNLKETDIY